MVDAHDVARLVHLNGGQLIGKTRLQKSAYFLEVKGVGLNIDFSYHRFGPYSEELSGAVDDAVALKIIDVDWKLSQAGTAYAIFRTNPLHAEETSNDHRRQMILNVLRRYSSVEVELAATADFLKRNGYSSDPWGETRRRKARKADDVRLRRSQEILAELEAI